MSELVSAIVQDDIGNELSIILESHFSFFLRHSQSVSPTCHSSSYQIHKAQSRLKSGSLC